MLKLVIETPEPEVMFVTAGAEAFVVVVVVVVVAVVVVVVVPTLPPPDDPSDTTKFQIVVLPAWLTNCHV